MRTVALVTIVAGILASCSGPSTGEDTGGGGATASGGVGGNGTGGVTGGMKGEETGGSGGAPRSGDGSDGGAGSTPLPCSVAWAGDIQWGTPGDDQLLGMTVDADDNIIVSGYERGVVGVTNIEPDGDARGVVTQFGPTGTIAWKTILDTPGTDTAEDVAIDPATGNLWVLGRTSGAFPSFVNQGQFDLTLASLDRTGAVGKIFQTGNERPQHPARLSVGPGGGIVVAGWDDTFVPTNYVAANQDGFVATFAADAAAEHGVRQLSLQYTVPPAANAPYTIANAAAAERDGSGAVYVVNHVSANRSGTQGIFVTKLGPDQSVLWNANISTFAFDAITAVTLSPGGRLFVTGGTFLQLGAQQFGQEDVFVMELDRATGAVRWAAQAGGADTDYPTALATDDAGNVTVAGITYGSVAPGVANQGDGMGNADIFAMKFSPTGERLSVWQTGTAADDQLTSVAVDHCGRAFVGGYTRGTLVPGSQNAGGQDMFVVRAAMP